LSVRTKTPVQAEKILTVAARLFGTQRFHETRMEDIAAAAGVGKGTLYRYFKDKDELYLALLGLAAEQISTRLGDAYNGPGDPRVRLEGIIAAILNYFEEQPHLFDLIQHAEVLVDPERDNPWNETRQETLARVRSVFAEGEEAGLFQFADPEVAALLLLGGLRAIIRFGARPRPADLARRVLDSFLLGHSPSLPRAQRKATAI
jgi:AcrR family transcriptional regulator